MSFLVFLIDAREIGWIGLRAFEREVWIARSFGLDEVDESPGGGVYMRCWRVLERVMRER